MIVDKRLRKIAPLWFERINRSKTLHGLLPQKILKESHLLFSQERTLDITSFNCCMVGEAYEFDAIYKSDGELRCNKCTSIAERVVYPIKNSYRKDSVSYFQRVIREFCNHLEKDHHVVF